MVTVQEQLCLKLSRSRDPRGGRRKRAGRKRVLGKRGKVAHRARPRHGRRNPVHVTLRAHRLLPSLREQVIARLVRAVVNKQRNRKYAGAFQVVHLSIQDDHLHLLVEATDAGSDAVAKDVLRSGISGFAISFARRLNRMLKRKGPVWADRHHRRDLPSPTETRSGIIYALQNSCGTTRQVAMTFFGSDRMPLTGLGRLAKELVEQHHRRLITLVFEGRASPPHNRESVWSSL